MRSRSSRTVGPSPRARMTASPSGRQEKREPDAGTQGSDRCARRVTRQYDARRSHSSFMTARRWGAARLRGPSAERQRDRLFVERQDAGKRRIRCGRAYLATEGTGPAAGCDCLFAKCRASCTRRRNDCRRCRRQALLPFAGRRNAWCARSVAHAHPLPRDIRQW
jgi:hypothetical protein